MTVGGTRSAAATGAAAATGPISPRASAARVVATTLRRIERLGRAEPRADRQRGGASVHRPWLDRTSGAIRSGQPGGPDRDDGRQPER